MTRCLLIIACLFVCYTAFSQKIDLVNSGEAINAGIAAYDSGNYEAAIKAFLKVNPRDTNYYWSQAELAQAYNGAKEYEKAIAVVEEALKETSSNRLMLLKTKAIALDKSGKLDQSIELFKSLLKKYPTDQNLVLNFGVTYSNNGKIEEAKDCFFRSLSINPYHAGSHLNLAQISINEGRKVHAMMSLGLYMIINDRDNAKLVALNSFLGNEFQGEGSQTPSGPNAFEKLDQIIRAKLAMEKSFKSEIPVDAPVVRQFEMLFQQLDLVDQKTNDPWVEHYLPFYKAVRDQSMVLPFIYHMISSANNDKVKSWNKKNEKTLSKFYDAANTEIKKQRAYPKLPEGSGFEKGIQGWYNDDGKLTALGRMDTAEKRTGRWVYFFTNGEKSAEGSYDKNGTKTGMWRYYNSSGILTSEENETTGEIVVFYPTGEKREHFFLKDGKTDGPVEIFYQCGSLKEKLTYKNGEIDGEGTQYFTNGEKRTVYNYKSGKVHGMYTTFFEDGKIRSRYTNRDGKAEGLFESFHANGKLAASGQYLDDKLDGEWKYHHPNGRLSRTGKYKNDLGDGEWTFYNMRGELTEKRTLKEGEIDGENSFYYKGKLQFKYTYSGDKMLRLVCYDRDGKVLSDNGDPSGNFSVTAYFSTGEKKSHGQIREGKLHGEWNYWFRGGNLSSKANYEKGLQHGEAVDYYRSGAIKSKATYIDGELDGYYQEFYEHGPVKVEGWYQNGQRQQTFLGYTTSGKVESDYFYVNDEQSGAGYEFHQEKPLIVTVIAKSGITNIDNFDRSGKGTMSVKEVGTKKIYQAKYSNGVTRGEIEVVCGEYNGMLYRRFSDGKDYLAYGMLANQRHGEYKHYDPENNLSYTGNYLYGKPDGIWKGFDEDGNLDRIGRFVEGNYDSLWTFYFGPGKIKSTIEYLNDERDGLTVIYAPDGSPAIEKQFESGDLIAYRAVTAAGTWSEWQKATPKFSLVAYYPSGKKSIEEQYANNYLDGVIKTYYPDGKLFSESTFVNGDYHGPVKTYHENGKLKSEAEFRHDERQGTTKTYYPDGSLRLTEDYVDGVYSGKVIVYKKGAKVREQNFWGGLPDE